MLSRTIMTTLLCGGLVLGTWGCQRQEQGGEVEESGAMEDAGATEEASAREEAGATEEVEAREEAGASEEAGAVEQGGAMEEGAREARAMGQEMELPDTTGAALWSYLESVDYRANWERWPGKGELYPGREPHGALLTTYLSPAAHQALAGMASSMPAGAIIVKENFMADSTLAATTVMFKVEGYDPVHNNWFWLKRLADGTIEVQGRNTGCITCHSARANNDYLFTGSLGGGGM